MNKTLLLRTLFLCVSHSALSQWNNTSDNSSTGNLTLGSTANGSYSKIVLRGPNSPEDINSKRDFIFDFAAAGKAFIRSYRGSSYDSYLQFMTSAYSNTGGAPSVRMHINGDGKVGIGTTTPDHMLTVNGDIGSSGTITRDDGTTDLLMYMDSDVGNWSLLRSNKGSGIAIIGQPDAVALSVSRINSFVGIGTTSPTEKLHVNGKVRIPLAANVDNNSPGIVAIGNDDFSYDGQYINNYGLGFHNFAENGGFDGINAYVSGFYGIDLFTGGQNRVRLSKSGNLLIGKTSQSNSTYKLDVAGKVRADEIIVNTTGADYVFAEDYQLKSFDEVEAFINENNHLPGIPSAAEMQEQGMSVGELNTKLLEKIEELTLYVIELKKENQELKNKFIKSERY